MARIDITAPPGERQGGSTDPVRANEQAWRRAMDSALFAAMQRDAGGSDSKGDAPRPLVERLVHRDAEAPAAPTPTSMPTQARTAAANVGAESRRPHVTFVGIASHEGRALAPSHHEHLFANAPFTLAQPGPSAMPLMQPLPGNVALNTVAAHFDAPHPGTAVPPEIGLPIGSQPRLSLMALPVAIKGNVVEQQAASAVPLEAAADPAAPPSDTHLFIEHTSDGAVVWLRNARGDLGALAPTLQSLYAEAARRGVRVAGLRLNGQPVTWQAESHPFHLEHPQGEDRGR